MNEIEQFSYTSNQIALCIPATEKQTIEVAGVELTAEPINGIATFYLDGIIRSLYADGRTKFNNHSLHRIDTAISAQVEIDGRTYFFVRGVAQAGRIHKAVPWTFLMTKTSLQRYEGYELGVVFCVENPDGLMWDLISWNDEYIEAFPYRKDMRAVVFSDISKHPTGGKWGNYIGIRFNFERQCAVQLQKKSVPANPFYVRWINELGGYDYHMFECNQQHAYELASQTTYDMQDGDGQQVVLDKTGNHTIEVSSGLVTRQNAIAIAKLVLSPDIRWYDEQAGKWIRITAPQQSISLKTEQPTAEVVLKFVLPYQTNQ